MHSPKEDPQLKEKPMLMQRRPLRSGALHCIYENGFVRYLSAGSKELIRSVYPAVRDRYWQTAPAVISAETVEQLPGGFSIRYRADYSLNDIRYTALVSISCSDGETLTVSFSGVAGSDFLRNRIGLCALLPPEHLQGKPCQIGHPDGQSESSVFPQWIHPVQPFLNMSSLAWESGGVRIQMEFDGDVFEAEDQRNWGDASYKIYSTPHHLPAPVAVSEGDKVRQEIRVHIADPGASALMSRPEEMPVLFQTGNRSVPFPAIGYSYNPEAQTPGTETIRLLRRLGPEHYRVELFAEQDWRSGFRYGVTTARALGVSLHVALFITRGEPEESLRLFLAAAAGEPGLVSHLIVFRTPGALSWSEAPDRLASLIRKFLPGVKCGSGTDSFFAHWNQQAAIPGRPGDFIAIPVNPQVHLTDTTTITENLSAMTDIIQTIRFRSPGVPVFISPLTLKMRFNPDAVVTGAPRFPFATDPRQRSLFAAAWTTLALRYLCEADKICLFEITGERGLVPPVSPEPGLATTRVFPLYLVLREIAAFRPVSILLSRSQRPLDVDGLVMQNASGQRLMIFCNFSGARQTLQIKTENWKTLPLFAKVITELTMPGLLEDGEKFRSAPYRPMHFNEGDCCRLQPGAILFLSTLRDWSFS